jgi:uncharacterized protein YjbI with pentapeptide repeats
LVDWEIHIESHFIFIETSMGSVPPRNSDFSRRSFFEIDLSGVDFRERNFEKTVFWNISPWRGYFSNANCVRMAFEMFIRSISANPD